MNYDIIIVGGGAAGLAAAISAAVADPNLKIAILERGERVGRKLATTGNGRCNITNRDLSPAHFHGKNSRFSDYALEKFGLDSTVEFFEKLGVLIKFDLSGRAYPYSLQAAGVTDALRFAAAELGVDIITQETVKSVKKGFNIRTDRQNYIAKRVIIAAGGSAAPRTGSDGSGCQLLKGLGHSMAPVFPAIVQLKTDNTVTRSLKGIKVEGKASVLIGGKIRRSEAGEILFTDYGLSGPPVLALSRIAAENLTKAPVEISLDLMPEYGVRETADMLTFRMKVLKNRALEEFFTAMLNKRLGQAVLKACGFKLSLPICSLEKSDAVKISSLIHDFRFRVTDTTGFANAQTTAGGVCTDEFDNRTMESGLIRGLYAAGEVLDIDGDCGGYNLQWAWSSGRLAGKSAAESFK